jgi:glyoxylase-like metal-dependent hydrolase (beta-lactamase superfamily II)/ferredoxin
MARLDQAHPANAGGDWFVDTRCIDCDTCRLLAPDLFGDIGAQSVVVAQPASPADVHRAWAAALACPTQSIGARSRPPRPHDLYPALLADGVYYCGYNSEDSFGANAFLAVRAEGNVLVDSPRFTRQLARPIEELGGIADVLLTHRDDVADAEQWAEHFGARVWIHEDDARAAPYATDVFGGLDDTVVRPGLVATPVPGHTRGSAVFVLDKRFCFSGDSLHWTGSDLGAFRHACWYSWSEQTASLGRLADRHQFEWVLAGHGGRGRRPAPEMHERLVALVQRMARSAA